MGWSTWLLIIHTLQGRSSVPDPVFMLFYKIINGLVIRGGVSESGNVKSLSRTPEDLQR